MKSRMLSKSRTKVSFIDEIKAKVELTNGETWIVGFPTPFNYLAGEHFIQLLGWSFDLFWGLKATIGENFRLINRDLYQDGYEMMLYIVLEPKKSEERKRDIDAKTLASRIGIDASNLSRIEQGHYSVGLDILSKIASALNAKVDIVEIDDE